MDPDLGSYINPELWEPKPKPIPIPAMPARSGPQYPMPNTIVVYPPAVSGSIAAAPAAAPAMPAPAQVILQQPMFDGVSWGLLLVILLLFGLLVSILVKSSGNRDMMIQLNMRTQAAIEDLKTQVNQASMRNYFCREFEALNRRINTLNP